MKMQPIYGGVMLSKQLSKLAIILCFISLSMNLSGQTPTENFVQRGDCSNFNSFIDNGFPIDIRESIDEITSDGKIIFDYTKNEGSRNFESIESYLSLDQGTSFELVSEIDELPYNGGQYQRFQQFYNGVEVEDAGYVVIKPGHHPCDDEIYAYISNEIDIAVVPEIDIRSVVPEIDILSTPKLVICPNIRGECDYTLAWKAKCHISEMTTKMLWIDAIHGTIIKEKDVLNGLQDKNCLYSKNKAIKMDLPPEVTCTGISDIYEKDTPCETIADLEISFHDGAYFNCPIDKAVNPKLFGIISRINAATTALNTAFGFTLEKDIILLFGCTGGSTTYTHKNKFYLALDDNGNNLDDILHEMTHFYLHKFFSSKNSGSGMLHEGFADILAVSLESIITNSDPEWNIGDRDLANPKEPCVNNNITEVHAASVPMSHWFYLVSQEIGIKKALEIVMTIIPKMNNNSGIKNFMRQAMQFTKDDCSEEGRMIENAMFSSFKAICLDPIYNGCEYHIIGSAPINISGYVKSGQYAYVEVCEELGSMGGDGMILDVNNPNGIEYYWSLPANWQGHKINDHSLEVTSFPKYPYYPRTFELCARPSTNNNAYHTECIKVILIDCDGNDPTCREYYDNGIDAPINSQFRKLLVDKNSHIQVFNLVGQLIYSGKLKTQENLKLKFKNQILFVRYLDINDKLIKTEKIININ